MTFVSLLKRPYRWLRSGICFLRSCARFLADNGGMSRSLGKFLNMLRRGAFAELWRASRAFVCWELRRPLGYELLPSEARKMLRRCTRRPLISIVVPMRNGESRWLERCLRSAARQYYQNWELIAVADPAHKPASEVLARWQLAEPRLRVHSFSGDSDAGLLNEAIRHCRGQFISFVNPDDELSVTALTWVIRYHNEFPLARWFYSDEDQITGSGRCHSPVHKPDFSPAYLLAKAFTRRLSVYEADLLRHANGFRTGFPGAEEHELALRISEVIPRYQIVHIPRVLYHRRACPGGAATPATSRAAAQKAVGEALTRRGIQGTVACQPLAPSCIQMTLHPRRTPRVLIILPTKNSFRLVRNCVDSLRRHTNYPNYQITVIDNQSSEPELLDYLAQESRAGRLGVFHYNHPFNHSDMHNVVILNADAELIVFVNNDLEMRSENWLEQMVATLELGDDVAGVGALLRYPDGRVQHGGIVLGQHGLAGHAHRFLPPGQSGYDDRCVCLQELSASTAACLLMKKSAFLEVGGFRADRYPTSFNEVDLWLRLSGEGYRCLYNPMVEATHFESATRKELPVTEQVFQNRLKEDWGEVLPHDPFYNPNLALDNEQFHGFRLFPIIAPLTAPSVGGHSGRRELRAAA